MNKISGLALLVAAIALAACTSPTSSVEGAKEGKSSVAAAQTTEGAAAGGADAEAKEEKSDLAQAGANIIQKTGTVQNKGVYIKLLVNKNPVTNYDINRRAAFVKLRRVRGNSAKIAEQEMIEQILKLQEATRANLLASDKMVDEAFANFAKSNRATPAQMARAMSQYGIGVDHFKSYIRTQISWRRVVNARFQSETTRVSERQAVLKLRDSGEAKPEVTEYSFQQVIFVVPKNRRTPSLLRARRAEANTFRRQFTSCAETLNQAKRLKDVSIVERNRIMEPELPPRWAEEVKNTDSKGTTRVIETERGVEMLALCDTKQVSDDRAAQISTQSAEFDSFSDKGDEFSKQYLNELKSRATIIYL